MALGKAAIDGLQGADKLKIVTIAGARPQFVKASIVSKALRSIPDISEILVHTGQHYDDNLSQVFFAELGIPDPVYNLGVGSGTHGSQTGRMLEGIEKVLLEERPDWVLVYGDTNSTLAGALAASKLHVSVAHVEAGLRSFNRKMPEEINRVLTDHVSDLLFAPTNLAVKNLLREGIGDDRSQLVGDVMYDAALCYGTLAERHSSILDRLNLRPKDYILATVHRAENTDSQDRLRAIVAGLSRATIAMPVVFPIHPRTWNVLAKEQGLVRVTDGIQFIDPVGYLDMTMLERNARLIVTDSGGVQKEAFFFSVPCVTLRTETEWQELIEMGWNRLAPPVDSGAVESAVQLALTETPTCRQNPYGDGHAAERIAQHLLDRRSKVADKHFLFTSISK